MAEALDGERCAARGAKGFDVATPCYGRVEVKYRQIPADGRREERVALSSAKQCQFDSLAIVILKLELEVQGAVLVPYDEAWGFVERSPFCRISYGQARSRRHAIDVTRLVDAASSR